MNYLLLSFSVSHRVVCKKLCSDSCTMFSWACCWLAFWTFNGGRQRASEYNFHFHSQVHSYFKNLLPESKLWRGQKTNKKQQQQKTNCPLCLFHTWAEVGQRQFAGNYGLTVHQHRGFVVIQPVCGLLLLMLLMVHQPSTEKSKVTTYKWL